MNALTDIKFQPSPALAAVVGSDPISRSEATKRLWNYIKKHGRQRGRMINADDVLVEIFNDGEQKFASITMFQIPKFVNGGLSKIEIE